MITRNDVRARRGERRAQNRATRDAFAGLILLSGLIAAFWLAGIAEASAQKHGRARVVPVEVATVEIGAVQDQIVAVGDLRADETVMVRPEIAGRLATVHFREGGRVAKGALLFSLDDDVLQAELADAEAALELAKRNFERSKALYTRHVGTERTRDEALAAMQRGEAKVALAKARLAKTRITAPFAGVLGFRLLSPGAYVSAGQDMVRLVKDDPIVADFRVPERFLPALAVGQTVTLGVDALPGRSFTGIVSALDNIVDVNGRSLKVRARVANKDGALRPGLFARVRLTLAVRQKSVIVPETAIVPTAKGPFVYRLIDGKAVKTDIRLGRRMPGKVEVLSGLGSGDNVVTAGQAKIRNGSAVAPVARQAGAS